MTELEEILLFADLDAGIDDLERLVDTWTATVFASVFAPREHVRITFLSEQPAPVAPEIFRIVGVVQEFGVAPVYVDEIITAQR